MPRIWQAECRTAQGDWTLEQVGPCTRAEAIASLTQRGFTVLKIHPL